MMDEREQRNDIHQGGQRKRRSSRPLLSMFIATATLLFIVAAAGSVALLNTNNNNSSSSSNQYSIRRRILQGTPPPSSNNSHKKEDNHRKLNSIAHWFMKHFHNKSPSTTTSTLSSTTEAEEEEVPVATTSEVTTTTTTSGGGGGNWHNHWYNQFKIKPTVQQEDDSSSQQQVVVNEEEEEDDTRPTWEGPDWTPPETLTSIATDGADGEGGGANDVDYSIRPQTKPLWDDNRDTINMVTPADTVEEEDDDDVEEEEGVAILNDERFTSTTTTTTTEVPPPPELIDDNMMNFLTPMDEPVIVTMPTEPVLVTDPIDDFTDKVIDIFCTEDVQLCPNGKEWVSRNPNNDCHFYPCQGDTTIDKYEDNDVPSEEEYYNLSNFTSDYSTSCQWHISSGYQHNTCSNTGTYPPEWDLIPEEYTHNYFFESAEECCSKSQFGNVGVDCVVLDYCNNDDEQEGLLLGDGTESTVHPNSIPQEEDGEYCIVILLS